MLYNAHESACGSCTSAKGLDSVSNGLIAWPERLLESGWHSACSCVCCAMASMVNLSATGPPCGQVYRPAVPAFSVCRIGSIARPCHHGAPACRLHVSRGNNPINIDNPELLVGDGVALTCFALYKQIAAIVTSPNFPGWLAPLNFNPLRFAEFANFAGMLLASWVVAAVLTGAYTSSGACSSVPAALRAVSRTWLVAMPVAAAQLVLVTAAESHALVGDDGFGLVVPLAASGPGEPLPTAAGVLGVMAMWRSFYVIYLDSWNQRELIAEAQGFQQALAAVALTAAVCSIMLQLLQIAHADVDGELQVQLDTFVDSMMGY